MLTIIQSFVPSIAVGFLQDTAGTAAPVAAAVAEKSVLSYIASGGAVAFILIALSIVAVALIVTNIVLLRRNSLMKPEAVTALEGLLRERKVDLAMQYCRQSENDCFLTRVIGAGLARAARSQFGVLELRPALEEAGAREADRLDRWNYALRVVSDLGPMLGLLGTVIGIIKAFATIGAAEGASRSSQLSSHMSEALVNTALGLSIAIPCLVAHAMFRRRADGLVAETGDTAERLVALLQAAPAGAGTAPRPAAPQPAAAPRPVNQPGPARPAAAAGAGT